MAIRCILGGGVLFLALASAACVAPPRARSSEYTLDKSAHWYSNAIRAIECAGRSAEPVARLEVDAAIGTLSEYEIRLVLHANGSFVERATGRLETAARLTIADGKIVGASECPYEVLVVTAPRFRTGTWWHEGQVLRLRSTDPTGRTEVSEYEVRDDGSVVVDRLEIGDVVLRRTCR